MHFSWVGSNIGNPAKAFFSKPIIQAQNIEVGPIYTESTNPAQHYIDYLLSKSDSINNLGALLTPLNIKYILLAKEGDYLRYSFLKNQTDLKQAFENEAFTVFVNEKYAGRIYQPEYLIAVRGYEDLLEASKTLDISRAAIITTNIDSERIEASFQRVNYTIENPVTYRIQGEHNIIAFTPPNLNAEGWVIHGTRSLNTLGFQAVYIKPSGREITYHRFNTYLTSYITSTLASITTLVIYLNHSNIRHRFSTRIMTTSNAC